MLKNLRSVAAPLLLATAAQAQTATATYELYDVAFSESTFLGPQYLTGSFTWTYQVGDFENGSGAFTSLSIPWTSETLATLNTNIDVGSIEITLPGSFHDRGVDISLKLVQKLTPDTPSAIDLALSKYEIQDLGPVHMGLVKSGEVAQPNTIPTSYGVGTAGTGGLVPTIASNGSFAHLGSATFGIDAENLLGGASAFTLVGFAQTSLPILGFDLNVDPAGLLMFPQLASGATGVAGDGTFTQTFAVPTAPALVGLELDLQVAVIDTGAAGGLIAASSGLTTTVFP
jgi:hypothetical protein